MNQIQSVYQLSKVTLFQKSRHLGKQKITHENNPKYDPVRKY